MADHMTAVTAEQLRAELLKLADRLSNLALPDEEDDPGTLDEASDIEYGMRKIAARLSGIDQLLADREVAVAQAVEFAEYVEQAAKGTMVERARHFLSAPYAAELRARLSGMAAVQDGQPAEFVVRQHLKHAAGGLFVDVWKTSAERAAMDCYHTYISDFPHQYFEVLRITHREDCLAHNGRPQFAAPEPPHA